jgi:hypothetical protein
VAAPESGFLGRVEQYLDDPIFCLRVSLLGIPVSWTESADLTRAEMVAIARKWNELQEDGSSGSSGPTERGPVLNG